MDCSKIGLFISERRKKKNMTQKELSEKIGVTVQAISKWERGLGCPDISLLIDLSKALDITVNELLCGKKIESLTKEQADKITYEGLVLYANLNKKKKMIRSSYVKMIISLIVALLILIVPLIIANIHIHYFVIAIIFMIAGSFYLSKTLNNSKFNKYIFIFWFIFYLTFLFISSFWTYLSNISIKNFEFEVINLKPLNSIFHELSLVKTSAMNITYFFKYLFSKIVILIPLPIFLYYLFKEKFIKCMLISFIISVLREFIQYITKMGVFDIDDIILGIVGYLIGYLILLIMKKIYLDINEKYD